MKILSEIKQLIETVQLEIKDCKDEDELQRFMKFHMKLTEMKRYIQDTRNPHLLN